MIYRNVTIGRWRVEFVFAPDGYDKDEVLSRLLHLGASEEDRDRIKAVIDNKELNTGFTFVSPYSYDILVAIGPASSGEQFVNTISHEIHHLAVTVIDSLDLDLTGESPAYLAGDTIQTLMDVICHYGCSRCNS